MDFFNNKLAIIGSGYVGLPLAVEFGKKFNTVDFDINPQRITELQVGKDRTFETSAVEMAEATLLSYTLDTKALSACNVFIVKATFYIEEIGGGTNSLSFLSSSKYEGVKMIPKESQL
jgi:UDP-N-acetyl-D-galactosamine dehydrogenase